MYQTKGTNLQKTPERKFADYETMTNPTDRRPRYYSDGDNENIYENISNKPITHWKVNREQLSKNVKAAKKAEKCTNIGNSVDSSITNSKNASPSHRTKSPLIKDLSRTDKLPKLVDKKGHTYYVLDIDVLLADIERNKTKDESRDDTKRLGSSRQNEKTREICKDSSKKIENSSIRREEIIKLTTNNVKRSPPPFRRSQSSKNVISRKNTVNLAGGNIQPGYTTPKPSRIAPPIPIQATKNAGKEVASDSTKQRSYSEINHMNTHGKKIQLNGKLPITPPPRPPGNLFKDQRENEQNKNTTNEDFSSRNDFCKQLAELKRMRDKRLESSHKTEQVSNFYKFS